jgi:GT2 family glycosyltransferase
MKLSVIIVCWNDFKVIVNCLKSIYAETKSIEFEVIVSDNGSTDGSPAYIREHFPQVQLIENGANLGYGRSNNVGIRRARGEYILMLNPDTILLDRTFEKLVEFADRHPQAGAFGCRVLNPDGSYQNPARPLPTVTGLLIAALGLRWLGRLSSAFESDVYPGWEGRTERTIGFQCGCCVLFRGDLLKKLGGFDERFFWNFDETDLCFRTWKHGSSILFTPNAEITHLGKQSISSFPIRYFLEEQRSLYRYFYKHYGGSSLPKLRWIALLNFGFRRLVYGMLNWVRKSETNENRLKMYRVLIRWHANINPSRFVQFGDEPDVGYPSPNRAPATAPAVQMPTPA